MIDGETQPGYADHPLVEILYTGQSDVFSLVWLQTGQNTIRGLSIDGYLPANLRIQPASLPCDHCDDANLIEDNYLGLEPDGVPSQTLTDLSVSGSSDNIIRNNRIAAGISDLVSIGPLFNDHPADNLIEGNFIGTTPDGRSIPAGSSGHGDRAPADGRDAHWRSRRRRRSRLHRLLQPDRRNLCRDQFERRHERADRGELPRHRHHRHERPHRRRSVCGRRHRPPDRAQPHLRRHRA